MKKIIKMQIFMQRRLPVRVLCLLMLLCLGCAASVAENAPQTQPALLPPSPNAGKPLDLSGKGMDRWYSVQIEGKPAGWSHNTMQLDPKNPQHIITRSHLSITLRRGPIVLLIEQKDQFTETLDHKPLEAVTYLSLGTLQTTRSDWTFTPKGIVIHTQEGDQKQERTAPLPTEKWMTPAQCAEYVLAQLAQGSKEFSYTKLEPLIGVKPVVYHSTLVGPTKTTVLGKVVPAILLKSTSSITPGIVMSEYVDDQGVSLRGSTTMMPGMSLDLLLADEAIAKSNVTPTELVASTLLHPDRKIKNPRQVVRGKYEMIYMPDRPNTAHEGEKENPEKAVNFAIPQEAFQQVKWINDTTIHVTVDLAKPVDTSEDQPNAGCKNASQMINSDDPVVRGLAEKAMKEKPGDGSPRATALILRDFVHGYIEEKNLSVGFASASEVARTKEGDCTEHGVLLAALLRVKGIPSRTASGLVYADEFLGQDGIFGYHMWTQAWLEDEKTKQSHWVDLDATLDCGPDAFDATHIALTTSAMADGETFYDMLSMAALAGRLKIRVLVP